MPQKAITHRAAGCRNGYGGRGRKVATRAVDRRYLLAFGSDILPNFEGWMDEYCGGPRHAWMGEAYDRLARKVAADVGSFALLS